MMKMNNEKLLWGSRGQNGGFLEKSPLAIE